MKLAEALALRAENTRKVEQLRNRIVDNARYQEGESPAEDAAALITESQTVLDELESLIRRINKTNATAEVGDGTMTDALARRDVLRLRHKTITSAADAASGSCYARQLRSELTYVSALSVSELRSTADDLARQLREVDVDIQRRNWEVDLID